MASPEPALGPAWLSWNPGTGLFRQLETLYVVQQIFRVTDFYEGPHIQVSRQPETLYVAQWIFRVMDLY